MALPNGHYYVRFVGSESDDWHTARWVDTARGGFWDIIAVGGEHFQFMGATPSIFATIGDPVT